MKEGGGIAIGIGVAVFVLLVLLPFLLVVALYTFFTIYGMTKGTDFRASSLDPAVWWSGLVLIVAMFAVLLATVVALAGRSLNPPKRRDRGQPQSVRESAATTSSSK
ncbi:MAG TPA: hypothetical protein VFC04_08285 [Actinomycetota bacterium]|jgi:ABC-type Fe3+ transport system permease subunit|nr:hypothetical protein [Actinomycetota bacterium]